MLTLADDVFARLFARVPDLRVTLAVTLLATALSGCGSEVREPREQAPATAASGENAEAVEKCTDRIVERAENDGHGGLDAKELRRYVETTYCAPFARRGWLYEDGALSIEAYEGSYSEECGTASGEAQPAKTVPCEDLELEGGVQTLDCGLLRYVRRAEVQAYVQRLGGDRKVECDDGTPVDELGVP